MNGIKACIALVFALSCSGAFAQMKTEDQKESSSDRTQREESSAMEESLKNLAQSMEELGTLLNNYADAIDEDLYTKNPDGSYTLHLKGNIQDYMTEEEAEALEREMESWSGQLEERVERLSEELELEAKHLSDEDNWIVWLHSILGVEMDSKTESEKSKEGNKKKIIRI